MPSSTDNVKLGVCTPIYLGNDLGFTKGGVEVSVSTSSHEVKVDQFGETPIDELVTGRMVKATVPMAETTLENLVMIMPGATLISDGVKATGSITFATAAATLGDTVTIGSYTFVFAADPSKANEVAPGDTFEDSAANFAAAVNAEPCGFSAEVAAGVVTLTADQRGTYGNAAFAKTGTSDITLSNPAGGVDPTKAKVVVKTGVNTSLLANAGKLVLRPKGTNGEFDFIINRAATAGALSFTYNTDAERVYNVEFKGYAMADDQLFEVGNEKA